MRNTPEDHAQYLYDLVSNAYGPPVDDYNHHQLIKPLGLPTGSEAAATFEASIVENSFLQKTNGNRDPADVETQKRHWNIILLNLTFVMYQRNWLLVPMDSECYSHDNYWTRRLDLSYQPMRTIVDYLRDNNLVEYREGKTDKDDPVTARISPLPTLTWLLWEYFLKIEQPIEPPYLIANTPNDGWEAIQHLSENHYEVQELIQINEFLKAQNWACKGPVQLKHDNNTLKGGRLYTPFQSLPDNKIRLRINTLINDKPIGEVGFSANQLRLNLAYDKGIDAGATPYEDIGEAAGGLSRNKVKEFITVAMGTDDIGKAASKCARAKINSQEFQRLNDATKRVFPDLDLFTGWGIHGQNYEGQILRKVMLEGIKKDIVCLPVHDAVAVQQEHLKWAKETMLECWGRQMETRNLSRVETNLP